MNQKYKIFTISLLLLSLTACTNGVSDVARSILSDVKVSKGKSRKSIAPDVTEAPEIAATVTLNKAQIMGKDFFYGADLQYSSIYDKTFDLYTQSEALGHIPAFFRVNGKELQLVADNRRLFPSDVNHPEQLISRFRILSETADTLTVSEGDASLYIVSMIDSKANSPKDHWARSFEFAQPGNYILQETSVVLQDGTIAEVMESIFPKETLATSKNFEKFKMDPTDHVGASDGPVARYRMLNGEAIFDGEDKLSFAQHFDINDAVTGAPKTIDWYVTANIKEEHLPVVKQAVEGWNRYFRKFAGINRDVVIFKGKVPAGVKIGDPRYNIINWDSRLVAGAAYESQATDPFTGNQSHSLIYMPVAWFQIGMDYWTNGKYSEDSSTPPAVKSLGNNSSFKLSCARDLSGVALALNSGRMSQQDAKDFSIQLMKQTLFHEVGHALGLAHNFKGSLSFDRKDPKSMFSTSIMDYNDYEIERAAFTDPNSADGPQLEYDRQALSAIYNKMADVKVEDKTLPACNDAEADTEADGAVDPLCIRYDIEKDPTLSVETALNRVNLEKMDGDITLAEALSNVAADVLNADALAKITSESQAKDLFKKFGTALKGAMNFYIVGGKASIAKTVRTNVKSLYVFEKDVLPSDYSELLMRERAFKGVQAAVAMTSLPEMVKKKIVELSASSAAKLLKTGFGASITADSVVKLGDEFEKDASKGLLKMRATILTTIANTATLPYYLGNSMDFEKAITTILFESVTDVSRLSEERLAAAHSLASYKTRLGANALRDEASAKIDVELGTAKNNESRELAISLKAALGG